MLEDIQIVFDFLGLLISLAENLYSNVALFLVAVYLLGTACLARLVYWLMGAGRSNE